MGSSYHSQAGYVLFVSRSTAVYYLNKTTMQVLLSCTECSYQEIGHTDKELMNKIIVWNHVRKAHPQTADRVMRTYQHVPASLFHVHAAHTSKTVQNLSPKFA